MLLNGNKRYSLRPKINQPATYYENEYIDWFGDLRKIVKWREYVYYEISEEILREMAYATSIEIKVTGASVSEVLKEDEETPSFLIIAKALYNVLFDNSVFKEDLKKEKQRIKEVRIEEELKKMAERIDEDEEGEEDDDEEYKEIRREAKKRKETDGRIQIKREWKELGEKCEEHNSHMSEFIGCGCSWETTEEEFIESFGKNPTELYNHLEFAIPLYDSLLSHMHEYNLKHPKSKVEIDCEVTEPEVRKFVAVLKKCLDRAKHLEGVKVEAESIEQEWKELQEKCKQHNSPMGQFIGRGCSCDTTEEEFIESFGKNPTELYNHLEFAIPLYESLLSHMHEYNEKYPKTKIEIDYVKEEKVRKFVEVLKQCRDRAKRSRDRAKRKSINAVIAVVIFVIIIICMLFIL